LIFAWLLAGASFAPPITFAAPVAWLQDADAEPGGESGPPNDGAANSAPAAASNDAAVRAYVGIYVNQIPSIGLRENEFVVDFWIWFRWRSDDLDPMATFEVANGRIDAKGEAFRKELPEGHYAATRVTATITKFWDVSRFPLDNHVLEILIEDGDGEIDALVYVPDMENSGVSPQVRAPGYVVRQGTATVSEQRYQTNYGDTSLSTNNESVYSRFVFAVPLEREGWGYFAKLFFGLFVATAIALTSFFIKPTEVDPRFGLSVGAIFAAVASEYVVSRVLPDTNVLTMADRLHILAFACIFITILESTYSLHLYSSGDEAKIRRSKRLDRASFLVLATAYIAGSVAAVLVW
jgi:hypothetical protein